MTKTTTNRMTKAIAAPDTMMGMYKRGSKWVIVAEPLVGAEVIMAEPLVGAENETGLLSELFPMALEATTVI